MSAPEQPQDGQQPPEGSPAIDYAYQRLRAIQDSAAVIGVTFIDGKAALELARVEVAQRRAARKADHATPEQLAAMRVCAFREGYDAGLRASVIYGQIAADPDGIGEGLQMLRRGGIAVVRQLAGKFLRLGNRQQRQAGRQSGGGDDVGQRQKFQSVDPVSERGGHQSVPSMGSEPSGLADDPKAIADRIYSHRLSEPSK